MEDLYSWFRRGLARGPDRVAVRTPTGQWTYSELDSRAGRLARALRTAAPEVARVGILTDRDLAGYAGILAGLRAGAAVVPLNLGFPVARTAAMVAAAQLDAVVVDARGSHLAAELFRRIGARPVIRLDPAGELVDDDPPPTAWTGREPGAGDLAYIMFTSGSTGAPKGVPITHGNVAHFLRGVQARYNFAPGEVFSQTFDLTFDLAMFDMFVTWGCGGTLVTVPRHVLGRLPGFVARHGITVWFSVPSAITAAARVAALPAGSLPSLRWSLFCGEALTQDHAVAWQRAAPNSTVENLYGPTELTIACSAYRVTPQRPQPTESNGTVPIGALFGGLSAVLVDEGGHPVDDVGELWVRGPQMFGGYLHAGDCPDAFGMLAGARYYRTGDLVRRRSDGMYVHLGRVDQQVKVHGYRVELAAVEWALRRCSGVCAAVVTAPVVDGELILAAFYTGSVVPERQLRRQLRRDLPDFMLPRVFWHVDALTYNGNGKIDRSALTRLARHRMGEPEC